MTGFNSKRDAAADKQHWNEDEWRRNNWRCGHGWLRGEQCEICNAAQEPDWKEQYEYQKRRAEMWIAKYEKDIGPLEKAQPAQRQWIWLSDADIAEVVDTTCQYTGGYEEYLIKKAERKIKELNT